MKKIISAFVFMFVLFLSGCGVGEILNMSPPNLDANYTLIAEIKQGDFKAKADVTRTSSGNWEFAFSEPSTISGLVIKITDGVYSAEYDGLSLESETGNSTYTTIPVLIAEALDSAAKTDGTTMKEKDGITSILGNTGKRAYTVYFSRSDNAISKLEIPSEKLAVSFTKTDVPTQDDQTETSENSSN